MTYAIYEELFPELEKKLNRVAKKCMKYGNGFTFEVVGEEVRGIFNDELKRKEFFKFILVEVEGTAKIDDWECIAVLEVHEGGNIIRRINTEIELPEKFKTTEDICEHCNSKRHRKNLYVIHNVKTNEWKQVGGQCLKLYTSSLSMEYVAAYMDGITKLAENDGVFHSGKPCFPVEEILGYAVEVIEKTGYFNAEATIPTKSIVRILAYNTLSHAVADINKEYELCRISTRFSQEDFCKEGTEETVEKIIECYKSLEDDSEFIHNVKVMLDEGYVQAQNFGFLSYLLQGYAKHLQAEEKKAKKIQQAENSRHFGEVGKRYKDKVIAFVECLTMWDTQWGITGLYKITLEDGTNLIWKTSNYIAPCTDETYDKITFTVKDHGEYNGEKQTEVTRCKVTYKEKK